MLLGQGYAPRHIAETLCLSVSTVEAYRERMKQKLGVESSPDAPSVRRPVVQGPGGVGADVGRILGYRAPCAGPYRVARRTAVDSPTPMSRYALPLWPAAHPGAPPRSSDVRPLDAR